MGLTTTKYFRWDDPGALKLDGTAGSFYAIIKHCLTEAGWSIEFDDPGNFKVVLRNSLAHGGSGGYLRVHDDATFTGGGRVANWRGYETMSDIDTGTLEVCNDWVWKAREAGGAQGADDVRRCWVIVADERTCYVNTWVGDDNASPRGINPTPDPLGFNYWCSLGWAGDVEPFVAGDPGFGACFMNQQNPGTGVNWIGGIDSLVMGKNGATATGGTTTFRLTRTAALAPTTTQCAILSGLSPATNAIGGAASSLSAGTPTYYFPALVIASGVLRGRMRGLYQSINNLSATAMPMGAVQTPIKDASGLQLVTMRGSAQVAGGGNPSGYLFVEKNLSWDDI